MVVHLMQPACCVPDTPMEEKILARYTSITQKVMQIRQYHAKKKPHSQINCFSASNISSLRRQNTSGCPYTRHV